MMRNVKMWLYFLCCIWLTSAESLMGSLDLMEIENVRYQLDITSIPVPERPADQPDHQLSLVNKFGQKFYCSLPSSSSSKLGSHSATDPDDSSAGQVQSIPELLSAMANQPCISSTKNWWTYEFCYHDQVKQFHLGEDGKISGPVVILGHFDSEMDWILMADEHQSPSAARSSKLKHHSQFYSNGTVCDLNGEPRHVEVRFECEPSLMMDIIGRVDEPQTCQYVMTIKTPRICSVAQFRPKSVDSPQLIHCSPVLHENIYQQFKKLEQAHADHLLHQADIAKKAQKEQIMKFIADENLGHIDMDTDEGLNELEDHVGKKIAEKLLNDVGFIFDDEWKDEPSAVRAEPEWDVEEIVLPSGELQSRLKKPWPPLKKPAAQSPAIQSRPDTKDDASLIKMFKSEVTKFEKVLQDIFEEISDEIKGNLEENEALSQLAHTQKELIAQLKQIEADFDRSNQHLDGIKELMDSINQPYLADSKKKSAAKMSHGKSGRKKNRAKALPFDRISLKLANYVPKHFLMSGEPSDRVLKKVEKLIQDKMDQTGLSSPDRTIEVTVINAQPFEPETKTGFFMPERHPNDLRRKEDMLYNLMIGDHNALHDLQHQNEAERSYLFMFDEETAAKQALLYEKAKLKEDAVGDGQPALDPLDSTDEQAADPEGDGIVDHN